MNENNRWLVERELNFFLADQVLERLLEVGLINDVEKAEIHRLNLETFQPFLAELMG